MEDMEIHMPDNWGHGLPEEILIKIFKMVVNTEGFSPFLGR
jgi:hypothetical protein